MSNIDIERGNAVREAWKNERALVMNGKGTRDWPQRQQIELARKGQVNGYDGHHMQSVKTHPRQAGNPNNIQFLNKSEHIKGAHKGDTKNSTNGYYNPKTKTMRDFGNRSPHTLQEKLSNPLSQNQISNALNREKLYQNRVTRDVAKANQWRQNNRYTPAFKRTQSQDNNLRSVNKGIKNMRSNSTKNNAQGHNKASQIRQKSTYTPKAHKVNQQRTARPAATPKRSNINAAQPKRSPSQAIRSSQKKSGVMAKGTPSKAVNTARPKRSPSQAIRSAQKKSGVMANGTTSKAVNTAQARRSPNQAIRSSQKNAGVTAKGVNTAKTTRTPGQNKGIAAARQKSATAGKTQTPATKMRQTAKQGTRSNAIRQSSRPTVNKSGGVNRGGRTTGGIKSGGKSSGVRSGGGGKSSGGSGGGKSSGGGGKSR